MSLKIEADQFSGPTDAASDGVLTRVEEHAAD